MAADRVSLTEGYEGAQTQNRGIGNEGESAHGLAKKQHGHTENLLSQNKGAFATQAGNGSSATANSLQAGAAMHSSNAAGGASFVRQTAGHEDQAAQTQSTASTTVDTAASDLISKINHA